jgi:hypothetical protein
VFTALRQDIIELSTGKMTETCFILQLRPETARCPVGSLPEDTNETRGATVKEALSTLLPKLRKAFKPEPERW